MTTQTAADPTPRAGGPTPCNPATLDDVCKGGCGRRLHHTRRVGDTRPCTAGHPIHGAHGMCPGCYTRRRRAAPPPRSVDLTWQTFAFCAGAPLELFFPNIRAGQNTVKLVRPVAERYCAACPVQAECDRYAEQTRSLGLWAGVWRRYNGCTYTRTPVLVHAEAS